MIYKDLLHKISSGKINYIPERRVIYLRLPKDFNIEEDYDELIDNLKAYLKDLRAYYFIIKDKDMLKNFYNKDLDLMYLINDVKEKDEIIKDKNSIKNFKVIKIAKNKDEDLFRFSDSVVILDDEIEDDEKLYIEKHSVVPLSIYFKTKNISIKPQNIKPDASGWVYNPMTGKWSKSWGWDGYRELNGW